jgi:hypothetical protein
MHREPLDIVRFNSSQSACSACIRGNLRENLSFFGAAGNLRRTRHDGGALNFYPRPQFDHAVRRDTEERRRILRVSMHRNEQLPPHAAQC